MNNLTISVFENQTFFEILKESSLFSNYKIKFHKDFTQHKGNNYKNSNELLVFFPDQKNEKEYEKIIKNNLPFVIVSKSNYSKNHLKTEFSDQLIKPFNIFEFEKKIISLFARYKFFKSSLINLNDYIIDKNERKIKRNNEDLQLTEKEINLLLLFVKYKTPLSKNFVLENVWKYSADSDTHTVETHIHRLRKKVLEKFNDDNFIKNNEKGYYI